MDDEKIFLIKDIIDFKLEKDPNLSDSKLSRIFDILYEFSSKDLYYIKSEIKKKNGQ